MPTIFPSLPFPTLAGREEGSDAWLATLGGWGEEDQFPSPFQDPLLGSGRRGVTAGDLLSAAWRGMAQAVPGSGRQQAGQAGGSRQTTHLSAWHLLSLL